MALDSLDIAVLLAYLGIILGIGLYFARRNNSTEEYFVGNRSFPGWAIGLSLVGTSISSITFIAYPADAYKTAWLRYLPNLMLPLAVIIAASLFLPFFRRGGITSAYQYLEERFGPSVRVYGAAAFSVAQVVRISTVLYLLALLAHEMTGLDPVASIFVAGGFVALYTVIGGIDAVIWTDVMQTIVLLLGGLLCIAAIVAALPGGLTQVMEIATTDGKLALAEWQGGVLHPVGWGLSLTEKTATMMLVLGITHWLTEYSSNQNTVQRYCAARSSAEARRGMYICAAASLPIWAFYMFLGTALYAFFQVFPSTEAAAMLDGTRKAEQILPYFITHYLPSGLVGLVTAAALAAAMSSLDSSINAVATVSIVDVYRRHWRPGRSDRHYLSAARGIATATSVLMVIGALFLLEAETKTLQDTATILASVFGGGLLGLYLLGFFTERGGPKAAWAGIAAAGLFTLWALLADRQWLPALFDLPFDLYYTTVLSNLLTFSVGFVVASILGEKKKPRGTAY